MCVGRHVWICLQCADCDFVSGPEFHSGNFPIESIRAASLAGQPRERRYCSECKPYFGHSHGLDYENIYDFVAMTDHEDGWCCCLLADRFIEDCWLCLPCFFKQEAQAYSRCLKRRAYKWEDGEDGKTRTLAKTVTGFSPFLLYCC